jgi:hypothetical protein
MKSTIGRLRSCGVLLPSTVSVGAMPQTSDEAAGGIPEIVVTAQKQVTYQPSPINTPVYTHLCQSAPRRSCLCALAYRGTRNRSVSSGWWSSMGGGAMPHRSMMEPIVDCHLEPSFRSRLAGMNARGRRVPYRDATVSRSNKSAVNSIQELTALSQHLGVLANSTALQCFAHIPDLRSMGSNRLRPSKSNEAFVSVSRTKAQRCRLEELPCSIVEYATDFAPECADKWPHDQRAENRRRCKGGECANF